MKIYVEPFEFSRDEYHEPFWIYVDHPEGKVSIGVLRYGCEEAKEVVPDLETFGNKLSAAFTERNELRAEVNIQRTGIDALQKNNAELRAQLEAVREAAFWVLHVANGVGKYGGSPSEQEYIDSMNALKTATQSDSRKDGG